MNKATPLTAAALGAALLGGAAQGSTIGYWQFNDGAAGTTNTAAGAIVNSASPGTLNGTASGNSGGAAPKFDADTPGLIVTGGLGGAIVDANNTTSLRFINGGLASDNHKSTTGGVVTINDPGGADSPLKPASFTVEAFIKIDGAVDFPEIIGKARINNNTSWGLDGGGVVDSNGVVVNPNKLRARIDSQGPDEPTNFSSRGWNQGVNAINASLSDGQWHHVAATFDDATHTFTIYLDYTLTSSVVLTDNHSLVYDDSPLFIGALAGGRAFDGWIDEVRLSDSVLTTGQFLRVAAVPEPASLAGLLAAAPLAIRRKRR